MASYAVKFEQKARKTLSKLDKATANMILAWIKKNLVDTDNPRRTGKPLKGEYKGAWRYRAGDYRLIAHIEDDQVLILLLAIGHRREVYDR